MKVTHMIRAQGTCPANGQRDHYGVEVHADRFVAVEAITAKAGELLAEPCYQEDFTQRLADALGCRVVTSCTHGQVYTRCECEPQKGER